MTTQGVISDGPFIVKRVRACEACRATGSEAHVPGAEPVECGRCDGEPVSVLSVKAVADLVSAQGVAYQIVQREWRHGPLALGDQPDYEDGRRWAHGLYGPGSFTLPDGSEIHVEATTWTRLMHDVPMSMFRHLGLSGADKQHICDRWNAEHGVSQEKEGERDG